MPIPRPDTRRAPPPPRRMLPMDDLDDLADARAPVRPSTDMAAGVAAKKPVAKVVTDRERQAREAYERDQRDQAEAAGQDQGAQGGPKDWRDAQDKLVEAEYARRKASGGGDDLDDLAQQRQAASDEIDAKNAQAAMDQRSRAGLGGLGLSGAASAAESDLARVQGRTKTLTMQEFDQAAEDQAFTEMQRRAALDDLEDAADIDYDGDGKIAGQTEDERKAEDELEAVLPADVPDFVGANKADAEEITAAEFNALPKGGQASPDGDYLYLITNEDPRRFLKVKGAAIGLKMQGD